MGSVRQGHKGAGGTMSGRELEILSSAAQGLTDKGIAAKLGITVATVGTYWARIRNKLGMMSRTELVANWMREEASATVAELRTENQRMIDTLEEYAQTKAKLQTDLSLLRAVVEAAPDAILLVDQHGIIRLANERAREMFGYEAGQLAGMPVERLIPAELRHDHQVHRAEYSANPTRRNMAEHLATTALRADGTQFPIAGALSALRTGSGLLVTCIIKDLTPWLERQLDASNQSGE